jgi:hypothetical protein
MPSLTEGVVDIKEEKAVAIHHEAHDQGFAPLSRLTHLKREGKQREDSGFRFLDAQIDHW